MGVRHEGAAGRSRDALAHLALKIDARLVTDLVGALTRVALGEVVEKQVARAGNGAVTSAKAPRLGTAAPAMQMRAARDPVPRCVVYDALGEDAAV